MVQKYVIPVVNTRFFYWYNSVPSPYSTLVFGRRSIRVNCLNGIFFYVFISGLFTLDAKNFAQKSLASRPFIYIFKIVNQMTSLEGACKIKSFINKGFWSRALDRFWQISIFGMNRTKVIFRIESLNNYSKGELKKIEKISKN